MNDRTYALPAIAACVAALGLPLFWMLDLALSDFSDWRGLATQQFNVADVLFLALGALMVIAYLGLRDWLKHRLNYRNLDVPLLVLVSLTAVFHAVMFLLSLATFLLSADTMALLGIIAWVGFVVVFGIVDVVIAIILLRDRKELPGLLTLYAVVSALLGLLELSVVFSVAALVLIPLQLAILALTLAYRPDVLEVI